MSLLTPCENYGKTRRHDLRNLAKAQPYNLLSDNLNISKEHVFFANLNLNAKAIEAILMPYIDLVGQRIAFTYKSHAKISFNGINGLVKRKLCDWLQFDDVCIKLVHVATGLDVFITISAQLARTLLIRLLATTLVDDAHGVFFSSTEKGIFSFILARLLLDLKRTLGDAMPDVKLIGVYHCQDESVSETEIANYGAINFSLAFVHDFYPVSLALPVDIFHAITPIDRKFDLVRRCGHLPGVMTFALAALNMTKSTVANLSFGDLIVFDRAKLKLTNGQLGGFLLGIWRGIGIFGTLQHNGTYYVFSPNLSHDFARIEDIKMEDLEIAGVNDDASTQIDRSQGKLAGVAKNIRVPLSIELARISFTLKELCQIREGEIIDLHRKIDDPLDMVIEGKIIGHCQPVQIDGRLGIRVLSIDGDHHEAKS